MEIILNGVQTATLTNVLFALCVTILNTTYLFIYLPIVAIAQKHKDMIVWLV